MTKYNLGKFNIKNNKSESIITASCILELDSTLDKYLKIIECKTLNCNLRIEGNIESSILKFNKSKINFDIDSEINSAILKIAEKSNSNIELSTHSNASLLGTDNIQLNEFVLKPGQIIEISLCDLTVTIDGENALYCFSNDSQWFDLLPGENEIVVSSGTDTNISVEIYWKDRWL